MRRGIYKISISAGDKGVSLLGEFKLGLSGSLRTFLSDIFPTCDIYTETSHFLLRTAGTNNEKWQITNFPKCRHKRGFSANANGIGSIISIDSTTVISSNDAL